MEEHINFQGQSASSFCDIHSLYDIAQAYLAAGRSVVPIAPGSKAPSIIHPMTGAIMPLSWQQYQSQRATDAHIRAWFGAGKLMGLGIVCGPLSGVQVDSVTHALEVLDIDDAEILDQFVEAANWQGLSELLRRLLHQRTPSGAGHFAYCCVKISGNTVLARQPGGPGKLRAVTLIETRGTGGQVIVAPTPPGIHPEHPERGYELVCGSWEKLPVITPAERQALFELARSFNTYVADRQVHTASDADVPGTNGTRPGDTLNQTASRDWWRDLLKRHDWTLVRQRGGIDYWRRPGKEGKVWSATLGACGSYFYVFSSNAEPFAPERAYSAFSAYALLEHNGDFKGAAKALAQDMELLPYSDLYNARAMVWQHGKNLRYCHPWKKWLVWTNTHWQEDHTSAVMQLAKAVIKRMSRQAETLTDSEVRALLAHVKSSLSTAKLKAMVESAQSEPGIPVLPEALDQDPWLLNCTNGTLDLRTGKLRQPHDRADLLTRCIPVAYDAAAQCPTWDAFLQRIMAENTNLINFLQRAVGYALTGVIREHVLLILWGAGRNGKSTFLNTLRALLGLYAIKAPSELLMVSNNDRHPTERADLFGKRFVAAIETEQGRRLAEVFVKEATGGDPIRARRMREDFWEFQPTHKVFLATNHKPVIKGTDHAIWERIRLIHFTVTIPKDERDPTLPDKLQTELPGILAWAVRGCLAWQQDGLEEPDEVQQATAGYRQEMDVLGQFIAECCLVGNNYRIKAAELYDAYKRWCEQNGEHPEVQRNWGMALTERGYENSKTNGRSWWKGIALIQVDDVDEGRPKNGIHRSPNFTKG